jgi:hypothetical protein
LPSRNVRVEGKMGDAGELLRCRSCTAVACRCRGEGGGKTGRRGAKRMVENGRMKRKNGRYGREKEGERERKE